MVWLVALPYFACAVAYYGYQFWGPTIIRDALRTSDTATSFASGLVALVTAIVMLVNAAHSDRTNERIVHVACGALVETLGFLGVALLPWPLAKVLAIALVPIGALMFLAPFWCLPPMLFRGTAMAAAIALVNSIQSLGGFLGPNIIGAQHHRRREDAHRRHDGRVPGARVVRHSLGGQPAGAASSPGVSRAARNRSAHHSDVCARPCRICLAIGRSPSATTRRLDGQHIASRQLHATFRRQLASIQQIPSRGPARTTRSTGRRAPTPLREQRDRARLERAIAAHHTVAARVHPRATTAPANRVLLDPNRVRPFE